MTEHEQKLLVLLKRLLRDNEDLHAQNDRLNVVVQWLGPECRSLKREFERRLQDDAAERTAADVFLGAAMDQLLAIPDRETT